MNEFEIVNTLWSGPLIIVILIVSLFFLTKNYIPMIYYEFC